jgi:hypothetical protein
MLRSDRAGAAPGTARRAFGDGLRHLLDVAIGVYGTALRPLRWVLEGQILKDKDDSDVPRGCF